jgi:hypothetical protein
MNIRYGTGEAQIETSAINILCHDGTHDAKVLADNVEVIGAQQTQQFSNDVTDGFWQQLIAQPRFMDLLRTVVTDYEYKGLPFQSEGNGLKHIVGLIMLTLNAMHNNKIVHWQYPESGLHPRLQLGLADLAIKLFR